MKKTMMAVLALFIMLPALVFAQKGYAIDKGVMIIDGSAGYFSAGGDLFESDGDGRITSLYINPHLDYFIVPHVAIGAAFNFGKWSHGDHSTTEYGVGPTAAFFLGNPNSKIYPFIRGSFFYDITSNDLDYKRTIIRFSGGAAFMVAKNVAITGGAFYTIESNKEEGADESVSGNIFGITFGIAAFVY